MTRALLLLALVLAATLPVERALRDRAKEQPHASELGLGRLAGGLMTGAFRPLLLNYLWLRGDALLAQGRLDELRVHLRALLELYPDNERAREFLGWHLAFNLANDAPGPAAAWSYAREGLDVLVASERGRTWAALWLLRRAGQEAMLWDTVRYAGPEWEREKAWRPRVRAWSGDGRFETAVALLEDNDALGAEALRAQALRRLAIEEYVARGESARAEEAEHALRDMADRFAEVAELHDEWERQADVLASVRAREPLPDYEAAVALWGVAARERSALLARAAYEAMPAEFEPEKSRLAAWVEHLEAPSGPPPPGLMDR